MNSTTVVPLVVVVGAVGAAMIYSRMKMYDSDSVKDNMSPGPWMEKSQKPIPMDAVSPHHSHKTDSSSSMISSGIKDIPSYGFRANPLGSSPAYFYSHNKVSPEMYHRKMMERKYLQSEHPEHHKKIRVNNHYLTHAGDTGQNSEKFYLMAAQAQSKRTPYGTIPYM